MKKIDFEKLNRAPYISRRMYIIEGMCESTGVDIEYLFGLFSLHKKRKSGDWFWQRARHHARRGELQAAREMARMAGFHRRYMRDLGDWKNWRIEKYVKHNHKTQEAG